MKDEMLKGYIIEGLNEIKRLALGGDTQFIIREADELIEERLPADTEIQDVCATCFHKLVAEEWESQ